MKNEESDEIEASFRDNLGAFSIAVDVPPVAELVSLCGGGRGADTPNGLSTTIVVGPSLLLSFVSVNLGGLLLLSFIIVDDDDDDDFSGWEASRDGR